MFGRWRISRTLPFTLCGGNSEGSSGSWIPTECALCRFRRTRKLILCIPFCLLFLFAFSFYNTAYGRWARNSIFREWKMYNGTHRYYLPFEYTILEENICATSLDFLLVVHSDVKHFDKRQSYRETFSNPKWQIRYNFRTVYAVAQASDEETDARVHEESEQYHDIIQADFADTYKNLTIKNLMWLRYVRDYCPNVKYILKIDDDLIFNLFDVVEELHGTNLTIPRSISCMRSTTMPVLRDPNSPWYLPKEVHPADIYLPYCSGFAYFLTADLVADLIRQSETYKDYISIDDAFMTGIVAAAINVTSNDMWQNRLSIESPLTERAMLKRKLLFGYYNGIDSFKRIWNSLVEMYGQG